jgi:putative salt-induced outer membrane protein YdiY
MRIISAIVFLFGLSAFADEAPKGEPPGFHNESQIGYIVVGGNAKSESFSGKQTSVYNWEKDTAKVTAHYLSSKAQDQTTRKTSGTAENWSTIGRWEHIFIPESYDMFLQAGISGDRFIGINLAQGYDLGGKYYWASNDKVKFFSELGYRYLHEDLEKNNVSTTKESHFIRVFSQIDYTHTESLKIGLWVEYLPDMKDNQNYRLNFSPYLLAILSDTFSLKFGYEGYYRNLPVNSNTPGIPNNVHFDFRHVTALIAKF